MLVKLRNRAMAATMLMLLSMAIAPVIERAERIVVQTGGKMSVVVNKNQNSVFRSDRDGWTTRAIPRRLSHLPTTLPKCFSMSPSNHFLLVSTGVTDVTIYVERIYS